MSGIGWVEWVLESNREKFHGAGVGREPVSFEAMYRFRADLDRLSRRGEARQLVVLRIDWVGNRGMAGTGSGRRGWP